MTSLQGYVTASFDEVTAVLGHPTYDGPSADGKVDTEWELFDEEGGLVTVYDWKTTCSAARCGEPYRWHIGGTNRWAVEFISNLLNKDATYA